MPAAKFLDPATGQWKSLGVPGYDSTPIGGVITWTRKNLPSTGEYVMADGAVYSETVYPDACKAAAEEVALGNNLWTVAGVAPNRTFTVPDLRDRFIYGAGAKAFATKSQANPALPNPGEETHLLLAAESGLRDHSHGLPANYVSDWTAGGNLGTAGNYNRNQGAQTGGVAGGALNASAAHNNMPPYVVLGFIVKLKAVSVQGGVLQGPQGVAGGAYQTFLIGDGVAKSFVINHAMGTEVAVEVRRTAAPRDEVLVDVEHTDPLNQLTIRTGDVAPAASELTVIVRAAGLGGMNITLDSWHTVGAAGEPAFQGAWVNFGAPYSTAAFRKMPDGTVQLRGLIKAGAIGSVVFTLPVGYRPLSTRQFTVASNNGATGVFCVIEIPAAGTVTPYYGSNTWVSLEGIEFDTESVLQAAQVGAQPMDAWHNVGAAGEPAFFAGVANQAGDQPVSFRKYPDGRVRLRGTCSGPAAPSQVFTLPVGYRPPRDWVRAICADQSGATCYVYITGLGQVMKQGSNTTVDLDLEFDTETVAAYSAGIIGPPKVTALPANPIDGQECYYVADAANGIKWHLRYDASSASAYKWEVVGGSDLYSLNGGDNFMPVTWGDAGTAGPSITIPLAGDYMVGFGALLYSNTAGRSAQMGIGVNSSTAITGDSCDHITFGAAYTDYGDRSRENKYTALPAAAILKAIYQSVSGGGGGCVRRWLRVRPVRVG